MAVGFCGFDEEKERERLRGMSDEELIREGRRATCVRRPLISESHRAMSTSLRCAFVRKNIAAVTRNNLSRMVK
jgi:hypothetical protein